MKKSPPDWLISKPIAHRGLHGSGIPENSFSSVSKAIEAGLPIEIDLQMTADGHLIVFHDVWMARLMGARSAVHRSQLAKVKSHGLTMNGEKVPTFREILELVNGQVPILIEVKEALVRHSGRASGTLADLSGYDGEHAIQSFDTSILRKIRPKTDVPIGLILGKYYDRQIESAYKAKIERLVLAHHKSTRRFSPDFIAHDINSLSPEISDRIREEYPLVVWTVDSQRRVAQAKTLADNIIFEGISPEEAGQFFT